jgi:hypothetical protein
MDTPATPVNMMPYIRQFILVQLLLIAILFLVQIFILDLPSSMGIITVMAAAAPPLQKFATVHRRELLKQERFSFTNMGAFLSGCLSMGLTGLAVILGGGPASFGLGDMPAWGWALIALAAFGLSWIVLYFASGFMVRSAVKRLAKAK